MSKKRFEQETIILWNNEDNTCRIDTCDMRMLQRLKELSAKYPDEYVKLSSGYRWAVYQCPKRLVSIRAPYSEERRRRNRETALSQRRVPPNRVKSNGSESEVNNG